MKILKSLRKLLERLEYKPFSDNNYSIGLEEGGGIFVVINKYSDFTIFKFLVNS